MKLLTTTEKPYITPALLPLDQKHRPTMLFVIRAHNIKWKQNKYRWYQTDDNFELVKYFTRDWDKAEVYEDLNKGKGKPYYHHVWTKK